MTLRGVRLAWKLRTHPPGDYAPFAVAVTLISLGIGVCAITGAAFRSRALLIGGACLLLGLQVVRGWAAHRFRTEEKDRRV